MDWIQRGMTYGNPKWHWLPGEPEVVQRFGYDYYTAACRGPVAVKTAKGLPEGLRPALGRNNVCAKCKKAYVATRPDLQAAMDLLNNKKDI